jgi:hypothetical protein
MYRRFTHVVGNQDVEVCHQTPANLFEDLCIGNYCYTETTKNATTAYTMSKRSQELASAPIQPEPPLTVGKKRAGFMFCEHASSHSEQPIHAIVIHLSS